MDLKKVVSDWLRNWQSASLLFRVTEKYFKSAWIMVGKPDHVELRIYANS